VLVVDDTLTDTFHCFNVITGSRGLGIIISEGVAEEHGYLRIVDESGEHYG